MIQREITRVQGGNFCTVHIELKDGRLSITGEEGTIVEPNWAKKMAFDYWVGFFEEQPEEIIQLNRRFNKKLHDAEGAAQFVLESDGNYHGLDAKEVGDKVYLMTGCGQIAETIKKFFPEVKPLLPWHLNDMKAGCEHQEKLGWGSGRTIALDREACTEAQLATLDEDARKKCEALRKKECAARWQLIRTDRSYRIRWIKSMQNGECSREDEESLMLDSVPYRNLTTLKKFKALLEAEIEKMIPLMPFEAAIYKDSLGAPCPTCGYKYGTEWLKRELPPEIVKLAETVCSE
jgi:hypothetical protein